MRVLIACEFSGSVRDAFLAKGHEATSCDLLPTLRPGPHFQGDVIPHLDKSWDLLIGHPPCTYLANSGVRWLKDKTGKINNDRFTSLLQGVEFFLKLWTAPIKRIALENPIQHKYAKGLIKQEPSQIIQPWQFGHEESKATCLWLKELPKLIPTKIVEPTNARTHLATPSSDRWLWRSIFPTGIAEAMADQWGSLQ